MRKIQQIRNETEGDCISLTESDSIMDRRDLDNEVEQSSDDIELQEVNERGRKEKILSEALTVKGDSGKRITSSMRLFAQYLSEGLSKIDAYTKAYSPRTSSRATITANANTLCKDSRISMLLESFEARTNARKL